jgi:hypothetical protein
MALVQRAGEAAGVLDEPVMRLGPALFGYFVIPQRWAD